MDSVLRRMVAIRVLASSTMSLSTPFVFGFIASQGLSKEEIHLVITIYAWAVLVLEVPTGYFADRVGRDRSMLYGAVAFLAMSVCYLFVSTFHGIVIAELFCALGMALFSGSDSSYLYDLLKGRPEEFARVWSRANIISLITSALLALIGGFAVTVSQRATFLLEVVIFATLVVLTMRLPKVEHRSGGSPGFLPDMRCVLTEAWHIPRLRVLTLSFAFVSGVGLATLSWYQGFYESRGLGFVEIGIAFSIQSLVAAAGAYLYRRKLQWARWQVTLALCAVLSALTPILMTQAFGGWMMGAMAVCAILPLQLARGPLSILLETARNELVSSELRATHGSVQSGLFRFVQGGVNLADSLLVTRVSFDGVLTLTALTLVLPVGLFLLWVRRKGV